MNNALFFNSDEEIILFASTVTLAIVKSYGNDDLSVISSLFSMIGDSISTVLVRRELAETKLSNNNEV